MSRLAPVSAPNRATRSGRGLKRYLLAALLLRLGDEGARVALVLLAVERSHGPGVGGLLVAALLVPHVVAAPAVGWLSDRARRPRRVLGGAAVGFAAALAVPAVGLGLLPLPVVVGVLLLGGCCGPALTGALTSQLGSLAPESALPRAFGADALVYNVSGLAGPAAAALVAGALGPVAAVWVLAGSAAGGAAVLATVPLSRRTAATGPHVPVLAGLRAVVAEPVLAVVTWSTGLAQLGMGALPVVAAVLAAARHRPAAAGWLVTAVAAGGLLGSLAWTWRPPAARRAPAVVVGSLTGSA